VILEPAVAAISEQNAAMRHALDVIREHEFLRESLAAKGVPLDPASSATTMSTIAEVVCARHGIGLEQIRGSSRERHIAWPRQEAMWLIRQVRAGNGAARYSTTQIGRYFGGRDHTTVLHAIKSHEARTLAQQEAA
jgi:chromosomal replication initiation ATPase DnaA